MLRLIHNQVNLGAILVDDIDDGLPNKTAHRLGSTADPKAYVPDGYANKPKQPCYIPYNKPLNTALPGYIDVFETERVVQSAGKGKIFGLARPTSTRPALIRVVSFVETDLAVPVIATATLDVPGVGDLTITGAGFLSLTPNYTTTIFSGTGALTLTQAQILAAVGGVVNDMTIVIPAALNPGWTSPGTAVIVNSDDKNSSSVGL
jgi:hypothetical protein